MANRNGRSTRTSMGGGGGLLGMLAANPDYVEQVLRDGAGRARAVASKVMERARKNCGLR